MGKKHKLSVLSDGDEALLAKKSKKERSLAVNGVPDQSDVDNLTRLFDMYDKHTSNRLRRMLEDNKLERALNDRTLHEEPVETAENLSFVMPRDLQQEVEKYWPTIWTNKEHLRWFLKKFPMFRR